MSYTQTHPDKPPMRIEYHGPTDDLGRCHFSLHWQAVLQQGHPDYIADGQTRYHEQGQHFFADPTAHGFPPSPLRKGS